VVKTQHAFLVKYMVFNMLNSTKS